MCGPCTDFRILLMYQRITQGEKSSFLPMKIETEQRKNEAQSCFCEEWRITVSLEAWLSYFNLRRHTSTVWGNRAMAGSCESHSETRLRVQSQSHSDDAVGIGLSWGHADGNRHGSCCLRTIYLFAQDLFGLPQFLNST